MAPTLLHVEEVWSFDFEEERAVSTYQTCIRWCVRLQTPRYRVYLQCCHQWSPERSSIQ